MSALEHVRQSVGHAWDSLREGWRDFYRQAAGAVTRFKPSEKAAEKTAQPVATAGTGWGVLAAEVSEDDKRVHVRLEAPGLEPEDFDLEVLGEVLVVRGRKQTERESNRGRYYIRECAYGQFERVIPLPDEVVENQASARYRNGVLHVELPKSPNSRRKAVKIDIH